MRSMCPFPLTPGRFSTKPRFRCAKLTTLFEHSVTLYIELDMNRQNPAMIVMLL